MSQSPNKSGVQSVILSYTVWKEKVTKYYCAVNVTCLKVVDHERLMRSGVPA